MTDQGDLRDRAVKSLNAKRGFWSFAAVSVIVWVFLVIVWALSGGGYFWPVWAIIGMGIGLAFSAFSAYGPGRGGPSEDRIQDEMRKLGG